MAERTQTSSSAHAPPLPSWQVSVEMLREVLEGATYDTVAAQHDVTRTAVERRIKAVALRVARTAEIEGLNESGAAFVRRLRLYRDQVSKALMNLEEPQPVERMVRILSAEEVTLGAQKIRARSHQPLEDLALFFLLLASGARPLEVARLEVSDYLTVDGKVRVQSMIRENVAINGRARPLYFCSDRLEKAMDAYLDQRVQLKLGLGRPEQYRCLDPTSRLFLSPSGKGFEILPYGDRGQRRFRCRAIQETYRKLFRYAELKQITALTVRHTVADRLYRRGADETQVGLLLGIAERSAVREQFPRRQPSFDDLTRDLV